MTQPCPEQGDVGCWTGPDGATHGTQPGSPRHSLILWNRSSHRADPLRALGAQVAQGAAEVFDRASVLVLLDSAADIDTVLAACRGCRLLRIPPLT
jgi:hypothetical protein